jgi:hypothetical protein
MAIKNSGSTYGAAAGLGVLSSGAGIGAIGCKSDDTSFYCRSSRFVMNVKNVMFIVACLALIYFVIANRGKIF